MSFKPGNRFQSKAHALGMAHRTHACTSCMHQQSTTFDLCPTCGVRGMRVYFRSKKELGRAMQLILLQRAGKISQLKFLPKFDLVVNGVLVCKYEADAQYVENGRTQIEDTKPSGDFMTDVAKFKIALFNAIYAPQGLSIKVLR